VTTPQAAAPAAPAAAIPDDVQDVAPPTEADVEDQQRAAVYAEGIRFVAKSHRAEESACFERALKDDASIGGGTVELGFTIDERGRAKAIRVVDNGTGSQPLAACLMQRVAEWSFPRPPAGPFAASYPFVFSRSAQ
jgi:hypothetical protein